jgi:hypothetical protein
MAREVVFYCDIVDQGKRQVEGKAMELQSNDIMHVHQSYIYIYIYIDVGCRHQMSINVDASICSSDEWEDKGSLLSFTHLQLYRIL